MQNHRLSCFVSASCTNWDYIHLSFLLGILHLVYWTRGSFFIFFGNRYLRVQFFYPTALSSIVFIIFLFIFNLITFRYSAQIVLSLLFDLFFHRITDYNSILNLSYYCINLLLIYFIILHTFSLFILCPFNIFNYLFIDHEYFAILKFLA